MNGNLIAFMMVTVNLNVVVVGNDAPKREHLDPTARSDRESHLPSSAVRLPPCPDQNLSSTRSAWAMSRCSLVGAYWFGSDP